MQNCSIPLLKAYYAPHQLIFLKLSSICGYLFTLACIIKLRMAVLYECGRANIAAFCPWVYLEMENFLYFFWFIVVASTINKQNRYLSRYLDDLAVSSFHFFYCLRIFHTQWWFVVVLTALKLILWDNFVNFCPRAFIEKVSRSHFAFYSSVTECLQCDRWWWYGCGVLLVWILNVVAADLHVITMLLFISKYATV